MPLRRNGDAVAPERLPRCAGTVTPVAPERVCDQAWTAFFPTQPRRQPRQGRAGRRTASFFTRLVKTANPLPLENKGRSPDSCLPTAISRFIRGLPAEILPGQTRYTLYIFYIFYTVNEP